MKIFALLLAFFVQGELMAQTWSAQLLRPVNLNKKSVPAANYSAIAWLRGDQYALVSDKEATDGFFPLTIQLDTLTGRVADVRREALRGNTTPQLDASGFSTRDCEGMVYCPSSNTIFISGEGDQRILEYNASDGHLTGRELNVPPVFSLSNIAVNYGFEALGYDSHQDIFWTTTESTLKADGQPASPTHPTENLLRLQSFNGALQPMEQYAYRMDAPRRRTPAAVYAFGVSAITVLPDGQLLVLEREFYVPKRRIGSWVDVKIYVVDVRRSIPITSATNLDALPDDAFLPKTLLASFSTSFSFFKRNLANYEGMCLGPRLADGRYPLLLVSDAQGGYGNAFYHMKDYMRVLLLSVK